MLALGELTLKNCDWIDDGTLLTIAHLPKLTRLSLNNLNLISGRGIMQLIHENTTLQSFQFQTKRVIKFEPRETHYSTHLNMRNLSLFGDHIPYTLLLSLVRACPRLTHLLHYVKLKPDQSYRFCKSPAWNRLDTPQDSIGRFIYINHSHSLSQYNKTNLSNLIGWYGCHIIQASITDLPQPTRIPRTLLTDSHLLETHWCQYNTVDSR